MKRPPLRLDTGWLSHCRCVIPIQEQQLIDQNLFQSILHRLWCVGIDKNECQFWFGFSQGLPPFRDSVLLKDQKMNCGCWYLSGPVIQLGHLRTAERLKAALLSAWRGGV